MQAHNHGIHGALMPTAMTLQIVLEVFIWLLTGGVIFDYLFLRIEM